jgi:hypothetical protein
MSDGLGLDPFLAKYNTEGSVTPSTLNANDVLTSPGGGTGATVGGLGSPYEQIPNGAKDGVNTSFFLDYIPASPPTGTPPVVPFWLFINGLGQSPYTPRYTLAPGSNHLVMMVAPKATDEFWCVYFRGPAAPVPSPIVSAVLTMVYTYTHSTTTDGFVQISHGGDILLFDNTAYTNRTWTFSLSPLPAGFGTGGWPINLELYNSLFEDGTDTLQVYEIYADVTHADATTSRLYPSASSYLGTPGGGDFLYVTHATGDGTHATYTVEAWGHNAVHAGDVLNVSGFTTLPGFNVSGAIVTSSTIAGGNPGGESGTITIANATVGSESVTIVGGGFNGSTGGGTYYGSVANVANALDGNSGTFATFTRDHYYPTRGGGGVTFTF